MSKSETEAAAADLMEITVSADEGLISPTLDLVEELAAASGVSERDSLRLRLNLEEILLSVFSYGYRSDRRRSVDVSVTALPDSLRVSVHDKGIPYDYETLRSGGGAISADILTRMPDGPVLRSLGSGGREQVLEFPRVPPCGSGSGAGGSESAPCLEGIEIHPMRPEEGIQVAQCLYDEFGYSYINDIVYYPERFAAAVESGRFACYTAVSRDGEVAAVLSLTTDPHLPGTGEVSMGVVRKKYRKASLMTRLTEAVMGRARELGMTSVFCRPVGYHPYTQKIALAQGMMPCCVELNHLAADLANSYEDGEHRHHTFCGTLMLRDTHRMIHCPPGEEDIAEAVIRNCGLDRGFAPSEAPAPGSETIVDTDINPILRAACIYVDRVGEDHVQALGREHRRMKSSMCELCNLYINLQDPAAAAMYDAAKALGYFVTGMLPASEKCDYLMMQDPFYGGVDYGTFSTEGAFGDLLELVRARDPEERR